MRRSLSLLAGLTLPIIAQSELRITGVTASGSLTIEGAFADGVCTVQKAANVAGPWLPERNFVTTDPTAELRFAPPSSGAFYRVLARNLSGGRAGFTNLTSSFGTLTTLAGAGGSTSTANKWQTSFEGGPATSALLSRPHIALGDDAGNIYIADKEGHGIRKVRPDGTIVTVAGTSQPGNGPDTPTPATQVALNQPNGLWVRDDSTFYVLDLANNKVRRVGTDGSCSTLFATSLSTGRGLWVSDDESLAYVSAGSVVKKWTPAGGVTDFAAGFSNLGNLAIDPQGRLVVTDRGAHFVYRIDSDGSRTVIAGSGTTSGGGDGQIATVTGLNAVRAVWFLPTGAFFVGTDGGCDVWYVDATGYIHLFLHGATGVHAGDDTWFYAPTEPRIANVKAITADREGNLLITENDAGYVRKIRFLPKEW